jgi:hypothetical protein
VILADALAARLLLQADEEHVFVLGRPIEWICALRARYGLPCPTCGLTRSVVMSLHGQFARAWSVAPVGPVLVVGTVAFAIAMLVLALSRPQARSAAHAWIRKGAAVYAVGAMVIWLGGWAVSFEAALAAR